MMILVVLLLPQVVQTLQPSQAFAVAKTCLTQTTESCTIADLEEAYKILDSDVLRSEWSEAQQSDIDDLWRVIKMVYNGATVPEAIAARLDRFPGASGANAYQTALLCLDPHNSEICALEDLEAAFKVLDDEKIRNECSSAQMQVVDQLWRAIKLCYQGRKPAEAVLQAWHRRDQPARVRLYT